MLLKIRKLLSRISAPVESADSIYYSYQKYALMLLHVIPKNEDVIAIYGVDITGKNGELSFSEDLIHTVVIEHTHQNYFLLEITDPYEIFENDYVSSKTKIKDLSNLNIHFKYAVEHKRLITCTEI